MSRDRKLKNVVKGVIGISTVAAGISLVKDQKTQRRETSERVCRCSGVYEKVLKTPLDTWLSTGALITLSPLMGAIAACIKLTSKGPVFFKQERLGKDQKPFYIYKFRTMIQNAENIGEGIKVSSKEDPRITKIGKILRETSLDELPQLINIIKGDMAIIGPRPPVTYHPYPMGEYDDRRKHRFDVKPGLTGLAQAEIRNQGTWDERIEYDLQYVKHITLRGDIKIVIDTIKTVLRFDR